MLENAVAEMQKVAKNAKRDWKEFMKILELFGPHETETCSK